MPAMPAVIARFRSDGLETLIDGWPAPERIVYATQERHKLRCEFAPLRLERAIEFNTRLRASARRQLRCRAASWR
jgi:hypothetical protein